MLAVVVGVFLLGCCGFGLFVVLLPLASGDCSVGFSTFCLSFAFCCCFACSGFVTLLAGLFACVCGCGLGCGCGLACGVLSSFAASFFSSVALVTTSSSYN